MTEVAQAQALKIAGFLQAHPYTEPTRKLARYLTVLATILLISKWFSVSVEGIPIVGIKFSSGSENGAQFVLALACVVFLFRYLLSFLTDISVEIDRSAQIKGFFAVRLLAQKKKTASETDEEVFGNADEGLEANYHQDTPEPWWEEYFETEKKLRPLIERLQPLYGEKKLTRALRNIRLWSEGLFPILIAVIALCLSVSAITDFTKNVILDPIAEEIVDNGS